MSYLWNATIIMALLSACGGAEESSGSRDEERATAPAQPDDEDDPSGEEPDDIDSNAETYVTFLDPDSGFSTVEVHDADRQIVHFDAERAAMIWSTSGDAVGGWSTQGSDLSWSRSGVAFRVRFGTEAGERRAYFTETDRGTICNLTITGPESLAISATGERPPIE